jgi:enoyl-CoA hydratase/carnithine racemase
MALMYQSIAVEHEESGRVAVLTLNRPERRNALSLETMRELTSAFRAVAEDRSVYACILRGEGAAFSAGHDLRELQCREEAAYREIFDACVELMQTIQSIPQPVIAEVATVATAAGCQLVATCDLAIAAPEAKFATPGVRIGLFCSTPMVALSRAVGRKRAMEMLLTGDFIDAQTAANWGLVNRVVPQEDLHGETLALARKIGEASREIVALGKSAFYRQIDLDQSAAYAFTEDVMSRNALESDAQEGIAAFLEKRKASWR